MHDTTPRRAPRRLLLERLEARVLLNGGPLVEAAGPAGADRYLVHPDRFEDNDSFGEATRLGTVGEGYGTIYETDLNMDCEDAYAGHREDFYRVFLEGDELEVNIYFNDWEGDLDLYVYDESRDLLGYSESTSDNEHVHLTGLTTGYYYVEVYGFDLINPEYALEVVGSGGNPWTVTLTEADDPFTFVDADGDAVALSVFGRGWMEVTGTGAFDENPDLASVSICGGDALSQFLLECDAAGNGVQVDELLIDSRFDTVLVEGDVAYLEVAGSLRSTLQIDGALTDGFIRRDVGGELVIAVLEGDLLIGDDIEAAGSVLIGAQTGGTLAITDDLKGSLAVVGDADGAITIGDDVAPGAEMLFGGAVDDLFVRDDLKAGFTVSGDLRRLVVGDKVFAGASVEILGALGETLIGCDLKGTITANTLSGDLAIGRNLCGNSLRFTSADPISHDITIGRDLKGTLALAGAHTGTITIGDDIEPGGRLELGGPINQLNVGDDIRTDVTIDGGIAAGGRLWIGDDLRGQLVLANVWGEVRINDDLKAELRIEGTLWGSLVVRDDARAAIDINGDVAGAIEIRGDLNYLESFSEPILVGFNDWTFEPLDGTLTVEGIAGTVVQA